MLLFKTQIYQTKALMHRKGNKKKINYLYKV